MMMSGEALSAHYFFSLETSPKANARLCLGVSHYGTLAGSLARLSQSMSGGCLSSPDLVIFTVVCFLRWTALFLLVARSPCCFSLSLSLLAIYFFIFVYYILHKFIQNLKPRYHRSFSRWSRTPSWDKSSANWGTFVYIILLVFCGCELERGGNSGFCSDILEARIRL